MRKQAQLSCIYLIRAHSQDMVELGLKAPSSSNPMHPVVLWWSRAVVW
jgi:hypothetical protein